MLSMDDPLAYKIFSTILISLRLPKVLYTASYCYLYIEFKGALSVRKKLT